MHPARASWRAEPRGSDFQRRGGRDGKRAGGGEARGGSERRGGRVRWRWGRGGGDEEDGVCGGKEGGRGGGGGSELWQEAERHELSSSGL